MTRLGARANSALILDSEVISPLGIGTEQTLFSLMQDRRVADRVARFDASSLPVDAAAEVRQDLSAFLTAWGTNTFEVAQFDRKLELVLACAEKAADRFLRILELVPPERRGIVLGVGLDVAPLEKVSKVLSACQLKTLDVESLEKMNLLGPGHGRFFNLTDLGTVLLAKRFTCAAFQESVLTACSASSQAIGRGFDAIIYDDADVVIVGGMDSLLNLPAFAAFAKLGVIQPCPAGPDLACLPCDKRRRGTLLGEGAGLMLLASPSFVNSHGLPASVEMLGHGSSLDGYHITAPDPSGEGMKRAIENALRNAGVSPGDVDYVNLHGTGTKANDLVELRALESVLSEGEQRAMVSSTKDRHGHLIAAAGIVEAIIVQLCMTSNLVPRTMNLSNPVEVPGLDLVMGENRRTPLTVCMSNSFAFGGINTSLVFKRVRQ